MANKLCDSQGQLIGYIETVEKNMHDGLTRVILHTVISMLQNNCLFREHILRSTNKLSIDLKSATSFMLFITHGGKGND